MGLTGSAIQLDREEEEEEYYGEPMEEMTTELMLDYMNNEILVELKKWVLTKTFCALLATNSFLWKDRSGHDFSVIRTDEIIHLNYWNAFEHVNKVILFRGDEAFLQNMHLYPRHRRLDFKYLTLVTSNDNALEFIIMSFRLDNISLRLEFILDAMSYDDFPELTGSWEDYEIVRRNLIIRFLPNRPYELEIAIIDQRPDCIAESVVFEKINFNHSLVG